MYSCVPFVIYNGEVIIPDEEDIHGGKYVVDRPKLMSQEIVPFDEIKCEDIPICSVRIVRHTRTVIWYGVNEEKLSCEWTPILYVKDLVGGLVRLQRRVHELDYGIRYTKEEIRKKKFLLRESDDDIKSGEIPQCVVENMMNAIEKDEKELADIISEQQRVLDEFKKLRKKIWIRD